MLASGITAASSRNDFLTLLVAQLKHQDPLQPVEQHNFIAQLAQFSTLEGIERLNVGFGDMLKLQQITQGVGILGKQATYQLAGQATPKQGVVSGVSSDGGNLVLIVGTDRVPLALVQNVSV